MDNNIFTSLPHEVLLKIFERCDVKTLGRLERTCKIFRDIISKEDSLWLKKSQHMLCANSYAAAMKLRCKVPLSSKQRCAISCYWEKGVMLNRYNVITYTETMPWIILEKNDLILSAGYMISNYKRNQYGHIYKRQSVRNIANRNEITKFVSKRDHIIAGYTNGKMSFHEKHNLLPYHSVDAHTDIIYCLDSKDNLVVSGSKDNLLKIWRVKSRYQVELAETINMEVKILSTAILHPNNSVLVGLPGTHNIHPLQLFDIETGQHITNCGEVFRNGAGYLDIYPEDEHTFLCGGYETTVQLWDIRCPKACVSKWTEPYDNSIYCVRSDHHISIISGSCRNVVHLWDKRKPNDYKCLYIFDIYTSPVYSIGFDATHMYVAYSGSTVEQSFLKKQKD